MAFPLLGAFLALSIGAFVKRALIAIGFGTITYVGLQAVYDQVQQNIIGNYGLMAGASMQLADLAGVGQTLGILLGALAGRIALIAVSKLGSIL